MEKTSPNVYLILGTENSGRRKFLLDLILELPETFRILYFEDSHNQSNKEKEELLALNSVECVDFKVENRKIKHESITCNPDKIFFISSKYCDPSDMIESLGNWLIKNNCDITRIITIANCELIENNKAIKEWTDACIHFSDFTFLNRHNWANARWLNLWISEQKKKFYPARFEIIKKDKVRNPLEALDSQIFRNTLYFENDNGSFSKFDCDADKYLKKTINEEREKKIKPIHQY